MTLVQPAPRARTLALLAAGALLVTGCGADGGDPADAAATTVAVTTAQPGETAASEPPAATTGSASAAPASPGTAGATGEATREATGEATEEAAEEVVITIVDFAYEMPGSVPPGATVTVVNEDSAAHTVTSSPLGAFDVAVLGGQTVTFTAPEEPGEYGVICLYHANMTATLVVG